MKALDIRQKKDIEIKEEIKKLEKDLLATNTAILQGKEKNVKKLSVIKKDIARLMTILREKQILSEAK